MTEATKADVQGVSEALTSLAAMVDGNDRAIIKKLGEIQVELADLRSVVEAVIREGEPHDEEDEES